MLENLRRLTGYVLRATDGEIGRCRDFLFDDRQWVVRHMVADTGKWLPGRLVLVSPPVLQAADWREERIAVAATRARIADAPSLDENAPVSRQYEVAWFDHFGLPYYWIGPERWGLTPTPYPPAPRNAEEIAAKSDADPHLRSAAEIQTYDVNGSDGERVGSIHDFILDDTDWTIPYLVIDTHLLLPGGKVVVPTAAVVEIHWRGKYVELSIPAAEVEEAPAFDPSLPIDPHDADRLVAERPSDGAR